MPMTMKELLHEPDFQYISCIAGKNGLNHQLSGINVIESDDLLSFCRPNELIVTTGIHLDHDPQKLEQLIKQAYNQKVAGFIINIGPYIPEVSPEIQQFADENDFPLLTMEWKYRVADLLKNTIQHLSAHQTFFKEENDQQLLYNLIFRFDQPRMDFEKHLQQRGIPLGAELGIITCTTKNYNHPISLYRDIIYREFQHRYHHFLSFQHHNELIFLINRKEVKSTQIPFSKTVEKIYDEAQQLNGDLQLVIGMGNFYTQLSQVSKSYEESITVIHLITQHKNPSIQKYKELGAYKIIMNVPDQSIIQTFQQDMLGQLYFYDQLHHTDFVEFLKIYLEENGSANKISKRLFIHRNTVAYKINKIEALLDIDLNNTFARTNLNVAFMIEDILAQKKA
ncbi:MAG: PucR family transcriptional regulator ligand-binding domain-containing protein [Lysinibacillus sp.]